jgi:hypothetical protein
MRPAGGNHLTLRRYVEEVWQIPTDHFDPDRARNDALQKGQIPLSLVLLEASTYSRSHLKASSSTLATRPSATALATAASGASVTEAHGPSGAR